MEYTLYNDDCIGVMTKMENESVHNIITDGIWNIGILKSEWDTLDSNMEFQNWTTTWATEAYKILKPGGFLLSYCGTRTYGFMSVGIAQAGFEVNDIISHIFGQGMPKANRIDIEGWEEWQTPHLKPAQILVCIAQKPREGTYAENLIKNRTGCFNIGATKIGDSGRFPANVVFDEAAGAMIDAQSGIKKGNGHWAINKTTGYGKYGNGKTEYYGVGRKDTEVGGASRFFYCSKPSTREKQAGMGTDINDHKTVQSMKFAKYLIKLVCAENTVLLDPFLGSGSIGCAAADSGINLKFLGIEKDKHYIDIATKRIEYWNDIQPVDIFKDAG